jgi:peptide/nickel transport system substrate-binding protein
MTQADPETFMNQFTSWEISSKDNKWQGRNITRWRNEEYDKTFRAAQGELDPVKRAALFIKMNELVCGDHAVIPVVYRPQVGGAIKTLRLHLTGWDNTFATLYDWHREA